MNIFTLAGITATIALLIPIILLIGLRLSLYRSFPALFLYYLVVVIYSFFILGYLPASKEVIFYFGTLSNFLDGPLILFFLTYFSRTAAFRKKLYFLAGAFILFEIVIIAAYGFTTKAATIVLAPDMILVLCLSILIFSHQIKLAVAYHKAMGKAVMIAAILFAYAGYCFVYAAYYLFETPYKNDVHLILYFINIVSSVTMSIGLLVEQKRVKQLIELQTTRKELKEIYAAEQPKRAKSTVDSMIFKFDQHQIN